MLAHLNTILSRLHASEQPSITLISLHEPASSQIASDTPDSQATSASDEVRTKEQQGERGWSAGLAAMLELQDLQFKTEPPPKVTALDGCSYSPTPADEVLEAYQTALGRLPTRKEYEAGAIAIASGALTFHALIQQLSEFAPDSGAPIDGEREANRIVLRSDLQKLDPENFINFAYNFTLGRNPDNTGRDFYLRGLSEGSIDREAVLKNLALSPEAGSSNRPNEIHFIDETSFSDEKGQATILDFLGRLTARVAELEYRNAIFSRAISKLLDNAPPTDDDLHSRVEHLAKDFLELRKAVYRNAPGRLASQILSKISEQTSITDLNRT